MSTWRVKNLTIWENRRRAEALAKFRETVVRYFNDTSGERFSLHAPLEAEQARIARSEINHSLDRILRYVEEAGVAATVRWAPPPVVSGVGGNIHLLSNIFNLDRFDIPPQYVVDAIEQAVGVYAADSKAAAIRSFNPFFWISKGLKSVSSVPFVILEHAGLHGRKLEDGLPGRISKLLTELIALLTAAFGFLKLVGREDWITRFFK